MAKTTKITEQSLKSLEAIQHRRWDKLIRESREDPQLIKIADDKKPESQLKRLTLKSKDEIVLSGTPEEIGYLFAIAEIGAIDGYPLELSSTERETMDKRLSGEDKDKVNTTYAQLCALKEFEPSFTETVLTFQKDSAFLARFLVEWKNDERIAKILSAFWAHEPNVIPLKVELESNTSVVFDDENLSFKLDIGKNKEDSLDDYISLRSMFLLQTMQLLKAKIIAVERYVVERHLPDGAIPNVIALCIDDMKNELFLESLLIGEEFFRSHLNERVAKGETVTEEDMEKAIIPDYYEIKATEEEVNANMDLLIYTENKILINHE